MRGVTTAFLVWALVIFALPVPVNAGRVKTVTTRTYQASHAQVWNWIMESLHDLEELVAEEDAAGGRIVTEWVVDKGYFNWLGGMGTNRYRYKIKVNDLAENETQVSVRVDVEEYEGDGLWGGAVPSDEEAKKLFKRLEEKGGVKPLREY